MCASDVRVCVRDVCVVRVWCVCGACVVRVCACICMFEIYRRFLDESVFTVLSSGFHFYRYKRTVSTHDESVHTGVCLCV